MGFNYLRIALLTFKKLVKLVLRGIFYAFSYFHPFLLFFFLTDNLN